MTFIECLSSFKYYTLQTINSITYNKINFILFICMNRSSSGIDNLCPTGI